MATDLTLGAAEDAVREAAIVEFRKSVLEAALEAGRMAPPERIAEAAQEAAERRVIHAALAGFREDIRQAVRQATTAAAVPPEAVFVVADPDSIFRFDPAPAPEPVVSLEVDQTCETNWRGATIAHKKKTYFIFWPGAAE